MKITDNLHAFMWQDMMANNCNSFFIQGDKNILIDPGHYQLFDHVENQLSKLNIATSDIDLVIITHCHPDHMEAIKVFTGNATQSTIHHTEMDFIKKMAPQFGDAFGISDFEPDFLLQEGDLTIGDVTFQVILTPGHSPGSVCLYWADQKALFTGDVVFNQGVGRTDVPGGSGDQLKDSINRISELDVEYLLPGHMDIVTGRDSVKENFEHIKNFWFAYL